MSEEYFKSLVRAEESEASKMKDFLNTRMDKARRNTPSVTPQRNGPMDPTAVGARAQVHAFIRHHWIREASRQRYLDFCAFMEDELRQCANPTEIHNAVTAPLATTPCARLSLTFARAHTGGTP